MCSGADAPLAAAEASRRPRCAARSSRSPRSRAPSETRKRQRSWTCGSQAAFPIMVSPSASTAAITAFSVAITRRLVEEDPLCRASPSVAHLVAAVRSRSSRRARRSAWMCGSSRRRPITSPPGGGTIARPKRASSGPASRNEARMRRQSSSSSSVLCTPGADRRARSFSPVQSTSAPMSASSSSIVSTSRIRGTFVRRTGSVGEQAGGEDRQRAVLVAGRADRPAERASALDDEGLARSAAVLMRR